MEEIDLKDLFETFWNKKAVIIITVVVFGILGFVYSKVLKEPKFTATATMLLSQTSTKQDSSTGITSADISINNQLIATYKDLATSTSVVRDVLNNLNITDMTEGQLKSEINVTAKTGTQMLNVSVTDIDAYRATRVTNELTTVFAAKVKELYKIDNINVVDKAEVPNHPSNINHSKTILMFVAVGLVLSVGTIFIINMLDNTINSAKDAEKAVGLPVLAELPLVDFNGTKKKKKI